MALVKMIKGSKTADIDETMVELAKKDGYTVVTGSRTVTTEETKAEKAEESAEKTETPKTSRTKRQ